MLTSPKTKSTNYFTKKSKSIRRRPWEKNSPDGRRL